jgi:ABC-type branched-subunit amino acid transport system substrate-binding protein
LVKSLLVGVAAAVAALACAVSADPAGHVTVACAHAGVPAVINHVPACLISGGRCKIAFQQQYERHSFYCSSGSLAKLHKTAPPTTSTPASPVSPLVSNATQVVVPRGQPIQIAFANDSGSGYAASLGNAVSMAVGNHPSVDGFPVKVNTVDVRTCGQLPGTLAAATTGAYRITSNLQNVAVLGQVCSQGFAQALRIYETAGIVVVTGSATNPALPVAGPNVFNRTIVDDNTFDNWYATISQLPDDLVWRQKYTDKFGTPPSDFADLYYDAANIVINDIAAVSQVDSKGELVVDRAALAAAVRNTNGYPGVTCSVTIDSSGNRTDDGAALSTCAR